jgi:hypothetical protein
MPAFLHSPKPPNNSQGSSNEPARLAYSRTELTLLKLGFVREDLVEMPYSRAAWYIQAAAAEKGADGQDGPRDATQADIDAF